MGAGGQTASARESVNFRRNEERCSKAFVELEIGLEEERTAALAPAVCSEFDIFRSGPRFYY